MMMQRFKRWMAGLLALVIASGCSSGAFGASAEESILTLYDAQIQLSPGALTRLTLPGDSSSQAEYAFTPTANGLYDVYLFPLGDAPLSAEAELWRDGELLAAGAGSMKVLSCRLNADTEYLIKLSGQGSAILEIARETLSRCYDMPLELDDGARYSKSIARSGDVHWYAVTAETDGAAILACAPMGRGLRLRAWIFDESGRQMAGAEMLASGTAVMSAAFEAGKRYFIRVAASNGAAGKYTLNLLRDENAVRPEAVILSASQLEIDGRSALPLTVSTDPEGSSALVYLDSSDASVAAAASDGAVEGRREGSAVITAYAYGGARSSCRVTVHHVPVESVAFSQDALNLSAGEDAALNVNLAPVNATDRALRFSVQDETLAVVDKNGVLHALAEGETQVYVTCEDGGLTDAMTVVIAPAERQYRALFIGEQDYASTVETQRDGSVKSVESVMSLIKSASFDGAEYAAYMIMDVSRDGALSAIRRTFEDASEEDVSLVYITCHGFYQAGMTFFLMADGSVLSAADLERALRQVPGEIILLADCCGSGGLLGEASAAQDMLQGITSVFQGVSGGASAHGSKFKVIASAKLDQDSHRISFDSDGASGMATVFARALCDAMGWSMERGATAAMKADVNYDGRITLSELGNYLNRRVTWYLNLAGDYTQTVCVYPALDNGVVFARDTE